MLKELQALFRDPQGRRLLIAPVLLQLILFPFAATLEVRNNTLGVLNEDNGAASVELMHRLSKAQAFTDFKVLHSAGEARTMVENQDALAVLHIPADFSRLLAAGRAAPVQVILDGRRSNSGQIAFGYIQKIVQQYQSEIQPASVSAGEATLVVRHWYNPSLTYRWFIVPSLVAVIITISSLVVTALSVAREREQGTFEQLLVSPLSPGMIMVGKAVPAFLVGAMQGTIILSAGVFVYRIPFQGSLVLLYGSMMVYILALVGFGLLISSFCSTQQQAFLGVFTFMMVSIPLSGFVAPIDNMPSWLQHLTMANPLRHFIVIAKGVFLKDLPASVVWASVGPLLVISAVTLTVADLIFRRRVG